MFYTNELQFVHIKFSAYKRSGIIWGFINMTISSLLTYINIEFRSSNMLKYVYISCDLIYCIYSSSRVSWVIHWRMQPLKKSYRLIANKSGVQFKINSIVPNLIPV